MRKSHLPLYFLLFMTQAYYSAKLLISKDNGKKALKKRNYKVLFSFTYLAQGGTSLRNASSDCVYVRVEKAICIYRGEQK